MRSLKICRLLLTNIDMIKKTENWMGRRCVMHERDENMIQNFGGKPEENHLGGGGINWMIILKCILNK